MRKTNSKVVSTRAGCSVCHAGEAPWTGSDALQRAAQHHDLTGHRTWAEIKVSVSYGDDDQAGPSNGGQKTRKPDSQNDPMSEGRRGMGAPTPRAAR